MIVYRCDLCGEIRDCTQREIEQTEYDICSECWNSLICRLKGKGRSKQPRELVLLPTSPLPPQPDKPNREPLPGEPPQIYCASSIN